MTAPAVLRTGASGYLSQAGYDDARARRLLELRVQAALRARLRRLGAPLADVELPGVWTLAVIRDDDGAVTFSSWRYRVNVETILPVAGGPR